MWGELEHEASEQTQDKTIFQGPSFRPRRLRARYYIPYYGRNVAGVVDQLQNHAQAGGEGALGGECDQGRGRAREICFMPPMGKSPEAGRIREILIAFNRRPPLGSQMNGWRQHRGLTTQERLSMRANHATVGKLRPDWGTARGNL